MPRHWKDSEGKSLNVLLETELTEYQRHKFFIDTGGLNSQCPLVEELYKRIAKLSPKLRKALILSCYIDNSHKQVAKELGISIDTLKKRLQRAKRKML